MEWNLPKQQWTCKEYIQRRNFMHSILHLTFVAFACLFVFRGCVIFIHLSADQTISKWIWPYQKWGVVFHHFLTCLLLQSGISWPTFTSCPSIVHCMAAFICGISNWRICKWGIWNWRILKENIIWAFAFILKDKGKGMIWTIYIRRTWLL